MAELDLKIVFSHPDSLALDQIKDLISKRIEDQLTSSSSNGIYCLHGISGAEAEFACKDIAKQLSSEHPESSFNAYGSIDGLDDAFLVKYSLGQYEERTNNDSDPLEYMNGNIDWWNLNVPNSFKLGACERETSSPQQVSLSFSNTSDSKELSQGYIHLFFDTLNVSEGDMSKRLKMWLDRFCFSYSAEAIATNQQTLVTIRTNGDCSVFLDELFDDQMYFDMFTWCRAFGSKGKEANEGYLMWLENGEGWGFEVNKFGYSSIAKSLRKGEILDDYYVNPAGLSREQFLMRLIESWMEGVKFDKIKGEIKSTYLKIFNLQ